jgi:hypothetical protein
MFNSNHKSLMISADLSQAIYYGTFEMLGSFELAKLLKKTGFLDLRGSDKSCIGLTSSDVKELLNSIHEHYGLLTAQGFYLRIGRVAFQYLRRNDPQIILDNSIEKRMQLLEDQISGELEKDTNWLQKNLNCQMHVKKQEGNWIINVTHPLECPPEINNASYYFLKGFLQECLERMDNRHRVVISFIPDPVHPNSQCISIGSQLID